MGHAIAKRRTKYLAALLILLHGVVTLHDGGPKRVTAVLMLVLAGYVPVWLWRRIRAAGVLEHPSRTVQVDRSAEKYSPAQVHKQQDCLL